MSESEGAGETVERDEARRRSEPDDVRLVICCMTLDLIRLALGLRLSDSRR